MKKFLFITLLIAASISCKKEFGELKYIETIPGGCALENGTPAKSSKVADVDKVTCSVSGGNLDLFVGFNATCCGKYSTTYGIKGDTLIIKIINTQIGLCNCVCYYTFDFKFSGNGHNYKYVVTVDSSLTFTGQINP